MGKVFDSVGRQFLEKIVVQSIKQGMQDEANLKQKSGIKPKTKKQGWNGTVTLIPLATMIGFVISKFN